MARSAISILNSLPDLSTSWLRYMTALLRSINRERTEFLDSYLISAQIALQAETVDELQVLTEFLGRTTRGVVR